jgi:LPXTG-motif cell wall-anchored protein
VLIVTRHRILGLAIGMLIAIPTPAHAGPGYGYAKAEQAPAGSQTERDDAEQRGHVIPGEDTSPTIVRPRPAQPVTPVPPVAAASPIRTQSATPAAAPGNELPRTGGDDALLLLWFGALVVGAGLCMRRAIA